MLKTTKGQKLSKKELLNTLTYEKVKGKPIYYRDYEKVLEGKLPPEAVIGSSDLQAYLVAIIVAYLFSELDKNRYVITTNELGFFTGEDSFRLLDIAIFEKGKFKLTGKYTKIPPRVVIEIDTKADLKDYPSVEDYAFEKTQELLDAGVGKVIWIFTKPKKILLAESGKDWKVQKWDKAFEVLEGVKVNLKDLTEEAS